MSVKIEAHLKPGKKVVLQHLPSGATITTAAPLDNNGDGSSFSPTDLVAAALTSCTLTVMAIVADRNQYSLDGSYASIEKIMQTSPRRIAELPLDIHLPKSLSAEARSKLENAAHTCPVHHSLLAEIKIIMTFYYDC
jgi:putative redox protein